ncbi:putative Fe-containing alcohol dehydrogenase [Macrophomina phaseolina]|uniref:Fe-containing alcohol dehydrogenase n=1 Tax=Macrophomina phaseolina TaxID=35725 RepID=A0ABQ8GA33_9PEZI|nr:putative Fe-containing alcohol dehydrogenase [Macrophomina phaseolina]
MAHQEVRRPAFPDFPRPEISYGLPFDQACANYLKNDIHASRIYIIASNSLSKNTDALARLKSAIGPDRIIGVRVGMTSHTPWSETLEVVNAIKSANNGNGDADAIVTLGAGSLTDAAKVVALCLANNATTTSHLAALDSRGDWTRLRPDLHPPTARIVCVPTTLSGGEYSGLGAATNDSSGEKTIFAAPAHPPSLVVLDAQLSTTTPERVWLSTGFRAVDHCVETLCGVPERRDEAADESAKEGLKKLVPGLLRCKKDGADTEARHACQMGVVEAMAAVRRGVDLGASHGVGHQLGPLGVGHGETSCVLLPAVCRYNRNVNARRQEVVEGVIWEEETVAKVLGRRGLRKGEAELGELLRAIVEELGMPCSLKDVGVGQDKFEGLAKNSLKDRWSGTNPVPLKEDNQVLEILKMVAG